MLRLFWLLLFLTTFLPIWETILVIGLSQFFLFFFRMLFLWFHLISLINIQAFVNDFAEFLNFFHSLLVSFLNLLDYLKRSVFLTKHPVCLVAIFSLYLHTIICSSGTFYMKSNCTSWILALHTSTSLLQTNNALKVKSFFLKFIKSDRRFRCNDWPWNPSGTT